MRNTKWHIIFLGFFIISFSVVSQFLSELILGHESIHFFLCLFSIGASTIGGIVLSNAFEKDEEFIKKISPRLSAIIRKSSINTAMINKIIQSDSNSNLAIRIQDVIPHLSSVTTDLTNLIGGDLTSEINELNNNLKELQKVALQISAKDYPNTETQQQSEEQFHLLVNKISDLSDSLSPVYNKVAEVVRCPYCNHENDILIGQAPPASACPICRECKKRFHANRQHDGSILIKKTGGE